jgi:predicted MPP superfamily phosphohydrolase
LHRICAQPSINSVNRRTRNTVAAGVALAAAGLLTYAVFIEPRWLQRTHTRVHIRRLPKALEGLRIALLTDLHAGGVTPLSLVRRAVRAVMLEKPDIIAITGDLAMDDADCFSDVLDALSGLHAPLGVYAVPGNHDYIVGIEKFRAQIGAHPRIRDLTNTHVTHEVNGARVCIAGVDDLYRGAPNLQLPALDQRDVTILLAHTPDQAEKSRRAYDGVDLIVSGHTHGGQVRIPFLGTPLSSADHPELYSHGLRRRPWTQVYTSRGIGTVHLPMRFLTRPEIPILELTSDVRPFQRPEMKQVLMGVRLPRGPQERQQPAK